MLRYFASLGAGKTVLWCYLIWYLVTVVFHFDPAPSIWLNSIGISVVIGIALSLSVASTASWKQQPWQTFRLFMMPFCVSSFSSLIKGRGYILIFPPVLHELLVAIFGCAVFVVVVLLIKRFYKPQSVKTVA